MPTIHLSQPTATINGVSASLRYLAPFATVLALLGCAPDSTDTTKSAQPVPSCAADEYKTPSAGCCPIGWIVDGQGECVAPGVPADAPPGWRSLGG